MKTANNSSSIIDLAEFDIIKQAAFDNSPYAILVSDEFGHFVAFNQQSLVLLGRNAEELLEMRIPEVLLPEDIERGIEHFIRVKETGFAFGEYRYLNKNGTAGWWSVAATKISDTRFVAFCLDITDRKNLEQSAQEYLALLNKSEEVGNTGSWRLRHSDQSLSWSDQTYRIFGLEPGEQPMTLERFYELIHPDDRGMVINEFANSLGSGAHVYTATHRIIHRRTGEVRLLAEQGMHIRDADGNVLETIGHVRDITAQRQAEEETEMFRISADQGLHGKIIIDIEGNILFVNQQYAHIHGYTAEEMKGRNIKAFRCYEHNNQLRQLIGEIVDHGSAGPVEIWHIHKDGEQFPMLMSGILLPEMLGKLRLVAISAVDTQAYHKAIRDYKGLFDQMQDGFALHEIICDDSGTPVDYRFLAVNPAFEKLTGLKAEDVVGRTVLEVMPQTEPEWIEKYGRVALTGDGISFESYSGALNKYFTVTAFRPEKNQFATLFLDVTEAKKLEHRLRETSQYLENLINYANAPIIVWDTNFIITRFNQAFENLTGIAAADAIGQSLDILFPESLKEQTIEFIKATTSAEAKWETVEIPIQHKDGSVKTVLWNSAGILDSTGKTLVSTIAQGHDITERKKAEEKVKRSEQHLRYLLGMHRMLEEAEEDLMHYMLEAGIKVTNSEFAFWAKVDGEGRVMNVNAWSKGVMAACDMPQKTHEFRLDEIRLLGESVRRKEPVVVNHYRLDKIEKNGTPEGHVPISRFLSVPVLVNNKVVAIGAVANKAEEYDETDIASMTSLLREMWNILEIKETRQQLINSEEQYRLLFQNMNAGFLLVEAVEDDKGEVSDMIIVAANEKFTSLPNKTLDEIIGRPITQILTGINQDSVDWIGMFSRVARTGESIITEEYSSNLNTYFSIAAYQAGRGRCAVTYIDITDRKLAENELIVAKERAEESNRLKTHFMNNISHEIRTPLNGILGFGELMAMEGISAEERAEYLQFLKISSNRLMQTISDIMDISELEAGTMKVHAKEVKIIDLLKESAECISDLCADKQVLLSIEVPENSQNLCLSTDAEFLRKILAHLLRNAEKFTTAGQITLGLKMLPDAVEFYVRDTGRGIATDKRQMIFEPFMQEDTSTTRGFEGSGLGLSIVKGLLGLLGGSIRLESALGVGSTFYFTLPLVSQSSATQQGIANISETNKLKTDKKLILLAEDDESNAQVISLWLRKAGYDTLYAGNGEDAVVLAKQHPELSLILMDIKMPRMNGSQALSAIRTFRSDLPIIAITAYAMTGDKVRLLDEGFDDYLAKPFSSEELLGKINVRIGKGK